MVRPKNLRQLGFSLIGSTIDPAKARLPTSAARPEQQQEPEDGGGGGRGPEAMSSAEIAGEVASRHFVHTVLPDGLFSNLNCLKPGDELLQVSSATT